MAISSIAIKNLPKTPPANVKGFFRQRRSVNDAEKIDSAKGFKTRKSHKSLWWAVAERSRSTAHPTAALIDRY
jgi:hypothetical protein